MHEKIRVLQVFGQMNVGGAETMIMNIYYNIDRSRLQFDFVVHTEEKCYFDNKIMSMGGMIYHIPRYNGKNHFQYIKIWKNFFKKHPEYKIIHGHIRSTAAIYLKIAKNFGLITISHSHSTSYGYGLSAFVKNIFKYPIKYIADYLFACSESAGRWLYGEKALKSDKFYIIKNAIDLDKFIFNEKIRIKKRKELKIDDKNVIGHVGRFHPVKNHRFLIDIFKEINKKNKNSVLLLIGDGDLKKSIKTKVDKLGIADNVIFMGFRSDLSELYQAMDVFLFTSHYEGLPVVLIEAQAAGLPCIINDTIPAETKITELITVCELKKSPLYYAESVLKHFKNKKRINTIEILKLKGYDVKDSSKWLQEFYLGIA
jgi:glycosyltransferase involved in cell wall biosynthesis